MKSKKLMALINAKREEARGLIDTDMAKARELVEEVRGLEADLETVLALEQDELRELGLQAPIPKDEVRTFTREEELRALGKHLAGERLSDEERALVTVTDNGAVLPQGYINELMLLRKGFPALKDYCHVIPVKTKTGKMPVATLGHNKLAKLSSNQPIEEGAMVTNQVLFDIDDYGKFVAVENSLTADEVVGIIQNVLLPDFSEGAVASENEEIMKIVSANATGVVATTYEDLENAIDGSLPATKVGLITITNTAGYVHLKNKKDSLGRNLNLVSFIGDKPYFNNKPLLVIDDTEIAPTTEGNLIFYVANMREVVKFFDREQIAITNSLEFLFNKNQQALRAIERFDTELGSARSVKKIEFSPVPVAKARGKQAPAPKDEDENAANQ